MVASTFEFEISASVPATRLFNALTFDKGATPKYFPKEVEGIEFIQGNGEVGSVFIIKYGAGVPFKSIKQRVDGVDKDNLTYSYTIIDVDLHAGGPEVEAIETVTNVIKVVPADGGSVSKVSVTYHTKGDVQVTEGQVRPKERISHLIKNIEEYLIAEPSAYN